MLGTWYAATDRVMGRRIAESGLFEQKVILAILIAGILVVSLVWGWDRRIEWGLLFLGASAMCMQAIGWFARKRWAGRLVLDLSRPWSRTDLIGTVSWLLSLLIGLHLGASGWNVSTLILWFVVLAAPYFNYRLEIREQGIAHAGKLLRWGNIESCEWSPERREVRFGLRHATTVEFLILKVHMRRLLKALPSRKILVPASQREAVEAMLSRYLSDWPTTANGS